MRIITSAFLFLSAVSLLSADTLTLRDGRTYNGTYLGGTSRQVRLEVNGNIQTYDVTDVRSLTFNDLGATNTPPPPSAYQPPPPSRDGLNSRDDDRDRDRDRNSGVTLPIDTLVEIRMIESVDSERARVGQTFRASLDAPIMADGREIAPRGADVLTKLVDQQESGKITGRSSLTLALASIMINGRQVEVTSNDVQTQSSSRGARSAKVVGGTAALGAIIGGIAGGGKGAAIGAGSGAAVGTGAEVLTGGQKVKIPSETRLTFRLHSPVTI